MNVLILGGTKFIGRHLVDALIQAGHVITVFTRGTTPDPLPLNIKRLHGNRNDGLAGLRALQGGTWDVCVDVSGYTPSQVRASAQTLRDCVVHYVYVSAVSAYDHHLSDFIDAPITESNALLPAAVEKIIEINSDTYGPLKVACEGIVQALFTNRCTIVRPQVVAGAHDDSDRLSYWIWRAKSSRTDRKNMLAPGDGSDYLQLIDVRDVAEFICLAIAKNCCGTFNLAGHRTTWTSFMQMLGAQSTVWVPAKILRDAGLSFAELPLYREHHSPRSSLMHVSCNTAMAKGLTLTPLAQTIQTTREWMGDQAFKPALSAQLEAQLIEKTRG